MFHDSGNSQSDPVSYRARRPCRAVVTRVFLDLHLEIGSLGEDLGNTFSLELPA